MSDDIPHWALDKAAKNGGWEGWEHFSRVWYETTGPNKLCIAFARYIAEHEEPPVDQDLIKAREICARVCLEQGRLRSAQNYREGFYDATEVQFVLTALKEAHNA